MNVLYDVGTLTTSMCNNVWEAAWTVKDIKKYDVVGQQIVSPTFSSMISYNNVITWRFRCCVIDALTHWASTFLENISNVGVFAVLDMTLLTNDNFRLITFLNHKEIIFKQQCLSKPFYILREHVFREELSGGTFKIFCKIFRLQLVDLQQNCGPLDLKNINRIQEFDDFEKLLDNKNSSDVKFDVNGKEIYLHKAILGIRSPVFQAMFQHDMKEKQENLVKIDDIQYDVMIEVFRFIYAGKVNNIDDKIKDLFIAADKYSIIGLKNLCKQSICKTLKVENAVDYLNVAVMCNELDLKLHIIKFIANHLDTVSDNPAFKSLHSDVMYHIIRTVAKKKNDK